MVISNIKNLVNRPCSPGKIDDPQTNTRIAKEPSGTDRKVGNGEESVSCSTL